jgi:hypothetical protein
LLLLEVTRLEKMEIIRHLLTQTKYGQNLMYFGPTSMNISLDSMYNARMEIRDASTGAMILGNISNNNGYSQSQVAVKFFGANIMVADESVSSRFNTAMAVLDGIALNIMTFFGL